MTSDILSSLNTSGSGMNLAQLATDLTEAEIAPRKSIIETRIEETQTSISELAVLRSEMEGLESNLALISTGQALNAIPSGTAFEAEITDTALAKQETTRIAVNALAESQVLQFTGFESADATVDPGTITIDFGKWEGDEFIQTFTQNTDMDPVSITVTEGMTLQELADEMNLIEGVTARVIDVGDGTYTLGLASETGANNALRLTAVGDAAPTGTGIDITSLDTQFTNATHQLVAASDAEMTLNGITVYRESNTIDDLLPGITLTLSELTEGAETLTVETNDDAAYSVMNAIITEFNRIGTYLREVTARGLSEEDTGTLAGDPAAEGLRRQFESALKAGYSGFGDRPYYLADLGVETLRDGSMVLNETTFKKRFSENPGLFDAMLQDGLKASDTGVTISGTPRSTTEPGQYSLVRNTDTGEVTLNGTVMTQEENEDGTFRYVATTGALAGISVTLPDDVNSTTISFGKSLVSTMQTNLEEVLESNGLLGRRETTLAEKIDEENINLEDLDTRATFLEERYLEQFTAMEVIITQLNSTADYLENLINAWEAEAG